MKLVSKRLTFALLGSALLPALLVSGRNDSSSTAYIRVIHASPDAPNVAHMTASDYLSVKPGNHTIKVYPTGAANAVITAQVTLTKNTYTTVAAVNFVANIEGKIISEDNTAPTTGNIKLRLMHLSLSASTVDIYVTAPGADSSQATLTLASVPYSDYISTAAGSYEVRITPTGTKQVVIDTRSVALAAGQIRTSVALDDSAKNPPFAAILLKDLN